MSRGLEVTVGEEDRVIIITDYTYTRGHKAVLFRAPEDCRPEEPAEIDDIECHWQDTGEKLDTNEWTEHCDYIEDCIWEYIRMQQEDSREK